MQTLKILLAENVTLVRGALVALIHLEPDLKVIAAVSHADEIVPAAREHKPDVAVIDIDLPDAGGLSAAAQLHEELPSCRTLILTDLDRVWMLRRALTAHVCGYMVKDGPPEQLATAIRDIASGRYVIDAHFTMAARDSEENPLSRREHEVLRLAAKGSEPVEIAEALHLSVGTVRNYLTTIVTKLQARNRIDAIRTAVNSGWLTLALIVHLG